MDIFEKCAEAAKRSKAQMRLHLFFVAPFMVLMVAAIVQSDWQAAMIFCLFAGMNIARVETAHHFAQIYQMLADEA